MRIHNLKKIEGGGLQIGEVEITDLSWGTEQGWPLIGIECLDL